MKLHSIPDALIFLTPSHFAQRLCMGFAAMGIIAGAASTSGAQTAHFVLGVTSVPGTADKAGAHPLSIQPGAVGFSGISVGSSSPKSTLTFTFDSGGTIGAPLVLTKGEAGRDFNDAGTGTCTTNGTSKIYSAGDSCTIDVVFSPKYSGSREGAAVLTDASGTRIATACLYGLGVGPQITFTPGQINTLLTQNYLATTLDLDEEGNLYLAQPATGQILKETLKGGSYTETVLASGLVDNYSVAVDGSGSVYFTDQGTEQVFKETPSGNGYIQTVIPVKSLVGLFSFVSVDVGGNVYVSYASPPTSGSIVKETLSGGTYTESVVSTTIRNSAAITVDGSGNVYVTDSSNSRILKETLSAGVYTESVVARTSSQTPVAVDGSGSVYIADPGRGILKESPNGTDYTESVVVPQFISGDNFFEAIALNEQGNLYVTTGQQIVMEIDLADPPSLNFASTAVGATSSDSPQTVTVSNIGTAPMTFPVSATANNPSISAGFLLGSGETDACPILTPASSTAGTLASGSSCNLNVSFEPIAPGLDNGSLLLTDDSLNAVPNPTQTILLNGTGTGTGAPQAVLSPASLGFGNVTTGSTSASQSITLSNPGSTALTLTGVSISGANATKFAQTNNCGTSLAAGANCTISVTFSPDAAGGYSASITVSDNASGSPQTASLTGTGVAPAAPQAVLSPTGLAFGSVTTGATSAAQEITLSNPGTGALTIAGITVIESNAAKFAQTNNCGSSLAMGSTCTITVSFSPDVVGVFSASISVADNASGSPQTVALTGTGVAPASPQAVLTPASLSFPTTNVGSSAIALTAQLSNPGNASLTITGITIAGTGAGAFTQTNTCGASLAAGATCSISVVLTPTSAATYAASISVADNATGSPQSVQLSGSGAAVVVSDFSIAATNSPQTIAAGASGQYDIALTPLNGSFTSAINLSVAGLPNGITGAFSPASVTPNGSTASATLTVAVTNGFLASRSSSLDGSCRSRFGVGGAGIAFAMLLVPWLKTKRLRAFHLLLAALLLGGFTCLAGCGSGGFAGHTASKTYSLTVTGTSGSTQHATTVTLIVK